MPTSDVFQGVSNCYVFKSRLQEFAQKVGLPTPVYETIKEGPSHEPTFRSTVIVNNVRYDSLPGFFNRKAAEQSAAEVALMQLAHSGDGGCISQPVHETGLCKNLLQEYAQKMNYAIPVYECRKDETPGGAVMFSCTVDIGGIKYIGAAAKTKKEAEIKAARTALLAIRASSSESNSNVNSIHTVVPVKKKVTDLGINSQVTATAQKLKPKRRRFKKKSRKEKQASDGTSCVQSKNTGNLEVHMVDHVEPATDIVNGTGFLPSHSIISPSEPMSDSPDLGVPNENMTTALILCNDYRNITHFGISPSDPMRDSQYLGVPNGNVATVLISCNDNRDMTLFGTSPESVRDSQDLGVPSENVAMTHSGISQPGPMRDSQDLSVPNKNVTMILCNDHRDTNHVGMSPSEPTGDSQDLGVPNENVATALVPCNDNRDMNSGKEDGSSPLKDVIETPGVGQVTSSVNSSN